MTVLMVQDMLIARSPWFSVLEGMTYGFRKCGLALYPKSYLETPMDLFLVEHICVNVFIVVLMQSVRERSLEQYFVFPI